VNVGDGVNVAVGVAVGVSVVAILVGVVLLLAVCPIGFPPWLTYKNKHKRKLNRRNYKLMKRNTRNAPQNNSADRIPSRKGTPKFFRNLPETVVETLCIEFDAFPSRANVRNIRTFLDTNKKAVNGLTFHALKGDRFKLVHPVAGNHVCTPSTFLDAISRVNTVRYDRATA
jgi:hypothetical protein